MRTIEENMKRRIDMPIGSRQLIKKLVLIQQNTNRLIFPLVIERVKQRIKAAREEIQRIPAAILIEDRVTFNEIFRQ